MNQILERLSDDLDWNRLSKATTEHDRESRLYVMGVCMDEVATRDPLWSPKWTVIAELLGVNVRTLQKWKVEWCREVLDPAARADFDGSCRLPERSSLTDEEARSRWVEGLRRSRRLGVGDTAALVGVGKDAVKRWEDGLRCPSVDVVARMVYLFSDSLLSFCPRQTNGTT